MEYKTYKTKSGIVRNDIFSDNFKTVCVSLDFYLPIDKRTASYISLLCAVLKRGNEVFGQMDKIGEFLDENYGATLSITTSKTGDFQRLGITAGFIDERFAFENEPVSKNIVSLIEAVLFCPLLKDGAFYPDFVEQEKRNLKDRIASLINDKRLYSLEKCKQIMFKNDVYGVYELGDADTVESISPRSLYDFLQYMLQNSMLYINYAGKKTDTDALFLPIISRLDSAKRPVYKTNVTNNVTDITYHIEQMPLAQSKLNLGFRLGKTAQSDPYAVRMFNTIYGASATSKLFNNVRERLSLCYYCASAVDYLKNVMFVYSGIETDNYEKARDEILKQLELMKSGDFDDTEFANARANLVDSYVQIGDSLGSLISNRIFADLSGNVHSREEQIEEIKKVTPERVKAVANDIVLDTVYLLKGVGGEYDAQ